MLSFFKKKQDHEMASPLSGRVLPLAECPDPVFRDKMLGDGFAVLPDSGQVCAPVNGKIVQIAHTNHALGIMSEDGLEILIHVGIDTVHLNGEGFQCFVSEGQSVAKGDRLMEMDIALVKGRGLSTISPCIITNMDSIQTLQVHPGHVQGGIQAALTYTI